MAEARFLVRSVYEGAAKWYELTADQFAVRQKIVHPEDKKPLFDPKEHVIMFNNGECDVNARSMTKTDQIALAQFCGINHKEARQHIATLGNYYSVKSGGKIRHTYSKTVEELEDEKK